ncbi:ComF family protein [Hydromonas duriensis]|uniref:ComF family protein n=1 Tax=Hydromonas duriensis TaxID=1527608 RepID=A0A4R6YAJ9_9BURK|nr:phosphoribosyltransferase family protein [Hydromonas duriensis]TDR32578.1 ComF family protein [Hydromonas duriensis]
MKNSILSWSHQSTLRLRNRLARWVGGCVHCGASGRASDFSPRLCQQCADGLTGRSAYRCQSCAVVLTTNDAQCLSCLQSPPPVRYTFAFADYHGALQHLILNYKFHHMLQAAPALGDALQSTLLPYVSAHAPDLMMPVPQFNALTHQRGFVPLNHVLKQIVWARGQPSPLLAFDASIRLHHAALQVSSSPEQRRKQIKGAFAVTRDLTGQRVLLIDDVYTTGATLHELASVCLAAGAKSVDALVLARARRVK